MISNTSNAYERRIIYGRVEYNNNLIFEKKKFFFFSSYVLYEINAHNVLIATQILIAYPTERGGGLLRYIILIRPRKRPRGRGRRHRHRRLLRPHAARVCIVDVNWIF